MRRQIGEIVFKLREEGNYKQKQLCHNLCSLPELTQIENSRKIPDYFLLDRLFERMGKPTERLEYVLSKEVYELYELRYQIQREILYRNLERAEELLAAYENKKAVYPMLHIQFSEAEKAQIAWIRQEDTDKILSHLEKAISQTMDDDLSKLDEGLLSADELKLLLFRWEISYKTGFERGIREVIRILEYVETRIFEVEELARIYPYVVCLGEKAKIFTAKEGIAAGEKALEFLREAGQIHFIPEILELLLKYEEDEQKRIEYEQYRKNVVEVEEEYGMHYENMRVFQYWNRMFELDYDVIRRTRQARRLSQEALCEDICAQETLSRIERGKTAPTHKNMELLLKKMKRRNERIAMEIVADKYEMIALEKEVAKMVHRREEEKSEELLKVVENMLDMAHIENQQYLRFQKLRLMLNREDCIYDRFIEEGYSILNMTLLCDKVDVYQYPLSYREITILNLIAVFHCRKGEREKGIAIWKKILQNIETEERDIILCFRGWELISSNLADHMIELGDIEAAIEISKSRLKKGIEVGKGTKTGRFLEIISYALSKRNDRIYLKYFNQSLYWYKLMKQEKDYFNLKHYAEQNNLSLN